MTPRRAAAPGQTPGADGNEAMLSQVNGSATAVVEIDFRLRAIDELAGHHLDGRLDSIDLAYATQGHCRRARLWLKAVAR